MYASVKKTAEMINMFLAQQRNKKDFNRVFCFVLFVSSLKTTFTYYASDAGVSHLVLLTLYWRAGRCRGKNQSPKSVITVKPSQSLISRIRDKSNEMKNADIEDIITNLTEQMYPRPPTELNLLLYEYHSFFALSQFIFNVPSPPKFFV